MNKNIFKGYRVIHLVIIGSILLAFSSLRAEESAASESFSNGTKEYLSDPARTGSLVGSILAGAAIANPFAPLLGGVAGFFIGKTSDYSDKHSDSSQTAYFGRSFMPKEGVEITSLTGLTGKKSPQTTEQNSVLEMSETTTINQLDGTHRPVNVEPNMGTGEQASTLQQQLTSACNNVGFSQPLPVYCYYYSQ